MNMNKKINPYYSNNKITLFYKPGIVRLSFTTFPLFTNVQYIRYFEVVFYLGFWVVYLLILLMSQ